MSYGITSDPYGFADTAAGISLQSVSNPVLSASEAKAMDSKGDVLAETLYDTTNGQVVTANYVCAKVGAVTFYDTLSAKDFRGGTVIGGRAITGVTVNTDNKAFATVSITGQKTAALDSDVAKYDWGITFQGGKNAQKFGYSTDTATRLNSSSIAAQVQVSRSLDSVGQELCINVSEGRLDATHNVVGVTGAPGGAADTGYTLLSGASSDESNTEYATGSAVVFKNISQA